MNHPTIDRIAIRGAGTMGRQIGCLCAKRGCTVSFVDTSRKALAAAESAIHSLAVSVATEPTTRTATMPTTVYVDELAAGVANAGLVLEALPEDLELKRGIFAKLDSICPPHVILASNSSSLRISKIETAVRHRERVCNMHFYQAPAPVVEIMGGSQTTPEVLHRARDFVVSLGLVPALLRKESTGFIYNRIWRAIKKESLRLVAEGVASPEEVDRVWMLIWQTSKGPFGWMDQVGLDVVRDIELVYADESGDPADRPPAYLLEMIAQGELGIKSGQGFYQYPNPAYEDPAWLRGLASVAPTEMPSLPDGSQPPPTANDQEGA